MVYLVPFITEPLAKSPAAGYSPLYLPASSSGMVRRTESYQWPVNVTDWADAGSSVEIHPVERGHHGALPRRPAASRLTSAQVALNRLSDGLKRDGLRACSSWGPAAPPGPSNCDLALSRPARSGAS